MRKINEKVIFELYRDYDICPTLISKGNAYKIYLAVYDNEIPTYSSIGMDIVANSTQNQRNTGRYFTFFKFLELIVMCSKCAYNDS